MFEDHNDTIYDLLKEYESSTDDQLDELNESHLQTGKPLADIAIDAGAIERHELLQQVADYLQYEFMDTPPSGVDQSVTSLLKPDVARTNMVVPI